TLVVADERREQQRAMPVRQQRAQLRGQRRLAGLLDQHIALGHERRDHIGQRAERQRARRIGGGWSKEDQLVAVVVGQPHVRHGQVQQLAQLAERLTRKRGAVGRERQRAVEPAGHSGVGRRKLRFDRCLLGHYYSSVVK